MASEQEFIRLVDQRGAADSGLTLLAADFYLAAFDPALFTSCDIHCPDPIAAAGRKRQAEYFAGRWLAARALLSFGVANYPLLADAKRCPQWPPGLLGSISHSDDQVLCAVATGRRYRAVGVDIQQRISPAAADKLQTRILSNAEILLLNNSALAEHDGVALCFSAKESIYKALYPIVQRYFGYRAAELVAIDTEQRRLHFAIAAELAALPGCPGEVELEFEQSGELLRSSLLLQH